MNLEHLEHRLGTLRQGPAAAEPPRAFLAAVRRRRRVRLAARSAPVALLLITGVAWFASPSDVVTAPRDRGLAEAPPQEATGFPNLAMLTRLNAAYDLDDVVLPAPQFESAAAPTPRAGFGRGQSAFNPIGF